MRRTLVLLVGLAACGPQVELGEEGTGSAASTSPSSSDGPTTASASDSTTGPVADEMTGAPGCGGECIEPPEGPWRGPLSIATVEEPGSVSCPAEYPQAIATFGHTLIDLDAPCECRCSSPLPSDCVAALSLYEGAGCGGASIVEEVGPACAVVEGGASMLLEPPLRTAGCEPWNYPPNSNWDLHTVLCEGQLSATCEGAGQCAPAPGLDGRVCWWAAGELECPAGLPERMVVYSAVEDHRTCADGCMCSGMPTCSGGVTVHESCEEEPPKRPPLLPGECLDVTEPSAITPDFSIDGGCSPSPRSVPVMGEIVEDAPQTLCCTG